MYPLYVHEKIEAHMGQTTCLRSDSQENIELKFQLRSI